jgi:hypothetical protein
MDTQVWAVDKQISHRASAPQQYAVSDVVACIPQMKRVPA